MGWLSYLSIPLIWRALIINGNKEFWGYVYAKDRTDNGSMQIIYTTDNWQTSKVIEASHCCNMKEWSFRTTDLPDDATVIEYAISYSKDGFTTWDNNFGRNYKLTISR